MAHLLNDLKFALRLFARKPGLAASAILTLALAIGANTAIFSVVYAVLVRPLPYPAPDGLVKLNGVQRRADAELGNLSRPDVLDFARETRTLDSVGAHSAGVGDVTITGGGIAERVRSVSVSSGYFRALHTTPALGRLFLTDDDAAPPQEIVILGDGLWRRRFAADPTIVGRTMLVNGTPQTIIGVLPRDFRHAQPTVDGEPEVYTPIDFGSAGRSGRSIRAIGRLRPGVSVEQAQADLDAIAERLARAYPRENFQQGVVVRRLTDAIVGDARPALVTLLGAVSVILLIACANLASLLLADGARRRREAALRTALGAARTRLVAQFLTEHAVLAACGAVGGLACGALAMRVIVLLGSQSLPRIDEIEMNGAVLLFTAVVACGAVPVFGLAPALQASRADVQEALSEGARGQTAGRARGRLRQQLVAVQAALAIVLLLGAGLLVRSFWRLTSVDPGFSAADQVLSLQMGLPLSRYPEGSQIPFYEQLYARIGALPGVEAAGGINILPFTPGYSCDGFQVDARPLPPGQNPCAEARSVSPSYFHTMQIPVLAGRAFTGADVEGGQKRVIINDAMARRFWPGENPVGQTMSYNARGQQGSREIIGVVANVRHFGYARAPEPEFYTPQAQQPSFHSMTVVIRTRTPPSAIAPDVRRILGSMDPEIPLYNVRTMDQLTSTSVAAPRFRTVLLGALASLALTLALVGVYSVIAFTVSARTQEIGLRLALGASWQSVVTMLIGQAMRPVVAGVAVGLVCAVSGARAMRSLLFETGAGDPLVLVGAPLLLILAAVVAGYLAARRAFAIDPIAALRSE